MTVKGELNDGVNRDATAYDPTPKRRMLGFVVVIFGVATCLP